MKDEPKACPCLNIARFHPDILIKSSVLLLEIEVHFAFIYSWDGMIPPTADNVKAYFISKELIGRGRKVTWIRSSQTDLYITREGITVRDLKTLKIPKLHRLSFLTRVFSFCLREKVKLVYLDCWFFTRTSVHLVLLFQALIKAFGVRLLYDARDPFPEYEIACGELKESILKTGFYRALSRMLYKLSDIILVASKEFKDYLVKTYAVNPSKIFVAYHGADVETFNLSASGSEARATLGLCGKFVVGWFGVMTRVRQVEQILIPLIEMAEHVKPDAVFLVGGKGRLRDFFERFASNRGNVLYLGYIPYDKLANYIAACNITLCPLDDSSIHGMYMLSRKISESLRVGVPVVVTKTAAVQSFFRGFRSVYMVDNTPEAFTKAIVDVSKNIEDYRFSAHNEAGSVNLSLQESCKRDASRGRSSECAEDPSPLVAFISVQGFTAPFSMSASTLSKSLAVPMSAQ